MSRKKTPEEIAKRNDDLGQRLHKSFALSRPPEQGEPNVIPQQIQVSWEELPEDVRQEYRNAGAKSYSAYCCWLFHSRRHSKQEIERAWGDMRAISNAIYDFLVSYGTADKHADKRMASPGANQRGRERQG